MVFIKVINIKKNRKKLIIDFESDLGIETFKIHEDIILQYEMPIKKGANIPSEIVKKASTESEAYEKAIKYLTLKDCSEYEMKKYLRKKGFEDIYINNIVEKLKKIGLLDDNVFAKRCYETLVNNRYVGPKYINQKMQQKGINKQIVENILNDYTYEAQKTNVRIWCDKKIQREEDITKERLIKLLLSKGFSFSVISAVLSDYDLPNRDVKTNDVSKMLRNLDKLFVRYSRKYNEYEIKQRLIKHLIDKGFCYEEAKSVVQKFLDDL